MTHLGLWTESGGGFVETGLYTQAEADGRLAEYVAEDPDNSEDLEIVEACSEHEDEPAQGCSECDA